MLPYLRSLSSIPPVEPLSAMHALITTELKNLTNPLGES